MLTGTSVISASNDPNQARPVCFAASSRNAVVLFLPVELRLVARVVQTYRFCNTFL